MSILHYIVDYITSCVFTLKWLLLVIDVFKYSIEIISYLDLTNPV